MLKKEEKESIIAYISPVLSDQIGLKKVANAVIDNDITISELQASGQLTQALYNNLTNEIDKIKEERENDAWSEAMKLNTIDSYETYLNNYPNGKNAGLAKTIIAGLLAQEQQQSAKSEKIKRVKDNINAISSSTLKHDGITLQDLLNNGVQLPEKIQQIYDNSCVSFSFGNPPTEIEEGQTEVYFWGVTGSGKTCTLAALLKAAKLVEKPCGGLRYFQQLSNIFTSGVGTLPPSTATDKFQAYSIDLLDSDSNHYPMTLLDLPGEIFMNFTNKLNEEYNPESSENTEDVVIEEESSDNNKNKKKNKSTFDKFLDIIQDNKNSKYHFFIVDVENDNIDGNGLTQTQYLNNAATYFEKHQIFNEKTAGVAFLVTKSDKLSSNQNEQENIAYKLLESKYGNFVRAIKSIAKSHGLIKSEKDKIRVIPFSIGQVYLRDKCIYKSQKANEVINFLLENIAVAKPKTKKRSFLSLLNE